MRVIKDTPFEFGYVTWQLRPPEVTLVVVVKGTFALVPEGDCTVASEQVPCNGEVHYDDDDAQSLQYDTDFAILKQRGECYLVGSCHAPGGVPVATTAVAFRVGSVTKSLAVIGDRYWTGLLARPTEPEPFTVMPLRWERSFGGPGFDKNPLGSGIAEVKTPAGMRRRLPNIEDPAALLDAPGDRPDPAGAFPIPRDWKVRADKTGTYDNAWLETRWPYLPTDFDYSYYNSAPADLQAQGFWRGDEAIGLKHLHPQHPVVRAKLPGLAARCFLQSEPVGTGDFREVPLQLDTIVVDSDRSRVVCTWRGHAVVADEKLTGLAYLFYVHEPLGEARTLEAYREWFARRLREEEEDTEVEASPPDPPPTLAALEPHREALARAKVSPEALAMELDWPRSRAKVAQNRAAVAAARAALEAEREPVPEVFAEIDRELDALEAAERTGGAALRAQVVARLERGEKRFAEEDLTGADLAGLDLREADFAGAILRRASLRDARLDRAVLDGADLADADLSGASAREASFKGAALEGALAERAVFDGAVLEGVEAGKARMADASFRGAKCAKAELVGADLARARFADAALDEADLEGATLEDADFTRATLVDATIDGARAARVKMDDADLTKLRASERADLTEGSFRNARADGSRWNEARLHKSNFSFATLAGADFSGALLVEAVLDACAIRGGNFREASLVGAKLIRCDVFEGIFEGADLSHADLRGSNLFAAEFWRAKTEFARLDLADVRRTKLERP